MGEVVSCPSSAFTGQAEDPLANACCPHCGYSLRGLPENRCPECGEPFDPARVTSFRPKWPGLMKWLLLAHFCAVVLAFPFWVSSLIEFSPTHALNRAPEELVMRPALSSGALLLVLGIVATIGLHRCRDWGRKAAIGVFGGVFLGGVLPVLMAFAFGSLGSMSQHSLRLYCFDQRIQVLQPLLIVAFLLTGLRPRSLTRHADEEPPSLLRAQFDMRKDWPLLVAIIFAGVALRETWSVVEQAFFIRECRSQLILRPFLPIGLAATVITAAAALCTWCAVVLQWRRPGTVRVLLAINFVTFLTTLGTQRFVNHRVFGLPPGPLAPWAAGVVLECLALLCPLLAILVFAVRELRDGDLRMARGVTVLSGKRCSSTARRSLFR